MNYYSFTYCYPYFNQDWRLFTPCPDNNFEVIASYTINGRKHYSMPISMVLAEKNIWNGREALNYSLTASCGYVAYEKVGITESLYKYNRTLSYEIFKNAFKNYIEHMEDSEITELKLFLRLENIRTQKVMYVVE